MLTKDQARLRVAPWPEDRVNPYQRLFYDALSSHGIRLVQGLTISDDCLRHLSTDIDVVHLHWPEYAWRPNATRLHIQARRIVSLGRFLSLAHRLGLRVWWTAHNLAPHEGNRWLNSWGYRVVASHADLVIAHSEFAAREVRRRYRASNVVVMPIGNFDQRFPPPRSRETVIRDLGLNPDRPLVACLGAVRNYKGIGIAERAVARFKGRVQLLVAGEPKPDVDTLGLQTLSQRSPWLRVLLRRLSDQEFSDFASASDAILLPYLRATTSAVLLASWTLGRGVVASDLPCFADELADHPGAGVLAPVGDVQGFACAIERYLSHSAADRSAAALAAAAAHDWPSCVLPLVESLQRIGSRECTSAR